MNTATTPPPLPGPPSVTDRLLRDESPWERPVDGQKRRPPGHRWLRRHGLRVGLAAVLIVAGAGSAGMLATAGDTRTEVLVTARPIQAGHRLDAADLRTTRMTVPAGVATIAASQQPQVVGRRVPIPMLAGQLLSAAVFSAPAWPGAGQAVVAVKLAAGQYPPDVAAGSTVEALFVAGPNTATTSSSSSGAPGSVTGMVVAVDHDAVQDGSAVVELRLPAAGADQVAAATTVTLVVVHGD